MPRIEFSDALTEHPKVTGEYPAPAEFPGGSEEFAEGPNTHENGFKDNEFVQAETPVTDTPETVVRKERLAARLKKNFLLQAAAVMTAVVLITSSMDVDVLGDGLSVGMMNEVLQSAHAKKGPITVSMLWETSDDLDLHIITPSGAEIYYGNPTADTGELDVDMQVGYIVEHPVENIYFEKPPHGEYRIFIHNFSDRNPGDPRVLVQVTVNGRTKTYTVTMDQYTKDVCTITY